MRYGTYYEINSAQKILTSTSRFLQNTLPGLLLTSIFLIYLAFQAPSSLLFTIPFFIATFLTLRYRIQHIHRSAQKILT